MLPRVVRYSKQAYPKPCGWQCGKAILEDQAGFLFECLPGRWLATWTTPFNAAPVSSWGEILHRTGSIDLRGGKETHFKRRTIVDNATAVFTMDKASPLSARKKFTGARKA